MKVIPLVLSKHCSNTSVAVETTQEALRQFVEDFFLPRYRERNK